MNASDAGLAFKRTKWTRTRQVLPLNQIEFIRAEVHKLEETPYTFVPRVLSPVRQDVVAFYKGGTPEAVYWYERCAWKKNSRQPAFDVRLQPDVVLVQRISPRPTGLILGDPRWTRDALYAQARAYIEHTTLVLDALTYTIVALYVTGDRDPAVATVIQLGWETARLCPQLYPRKRGSQFYGKRRGGHMGYNWLDGIQRFPSNKATTKFVTGFYRQNAACREGIEKASLYFTSMATLEKKHVPAIAAERVARATEAALPCIVPGATLNDIAASCSGLSINFACPAHIDSSAPGTTETMFFGSSPNEGGPYCFHIVDYNIMFHHPSAVAFYLCSTLLHGTAPLQPHTTDHQGFGSVLMSKTRNVAAHAKTQAANSNISLHAVLPAP